MCRTPPQAAGAVSYRRHARRAAASELKEEENRSGTIQTRSGFH